MEEFFFGTGGLLRAYSQATTEALNNCKIIQKDLGIEISIEIGYADLEKIKYYFAQNEMKIVSFEYLENIKIIVETTEEKLEKLKKEEKELNFKILKIETICEKYITLNYKL